MSQPKTPGAMVPINCRQRLAAEGKPYPRSSCYSCGQLSPKWRECDALIDAAPDEQAPAVGGEPVTVAWLLHNGDEGRVDSTVRWDVAKHWPGYAMPLIDRAQVALLLAEIGQTKDLLKAYMNAEAEKGIELVKLRARVAEMEAQQGEPVAWQRKSKMEKEKWFYLDPDFLESSIDQGYEVRPLYRQAQPAAAKVDMQSVMDAFQEANSSAHMVGTSNWCALMAEKLNGMKP